MLRSLLVGLGSMAIIVFGVLAYQNSSDFELPSLPNFPNPFSSLTNTDQGEKDPSQRYLTHHDFTYKILPALSRISESIDNSKSQYKDLETEILLINNRLSMIETDKSVLGDNPYAALEKIRKVVVAERTKLASLTGDVSDLERAIDRISEAEAVSPTSAPSPTRLAVVDDALREQQQIIEELRSRIALLENQNPVAAVDGSTGGDDRAASTDFRQGRWNSFTPVNGIVADDFQWREANADIHLKGRFQTTAETSLKLYFSGKRMAYLIGQFPNIRDDESDAYRGDFAVCLAPVGDELRGRVLTKLSDDKTKYILVLMGCRNGAVVNNLVIRRR